MFRETANLESTQKVVENYIRILGNTKDNLREVTNRQEKKELAVSMKGILTGMETNMNNSTIALGKVESQR